MGQRVSVATRRNAKRSGNNWPSPRLNIDVPLILVILTLVGFGLLMMHSASWNASLLLTKDNVEGSSTTYLFYRQLRWLGVGFVALIALTWINYHRWHYLSIIVMGVTLVSLLGVLIYGETVDDVTRAYFEGSIQPSELAKFAIVVYLAVWLNAKRDQLSDLGYGLFPLAIIVGITGGLILRQPDLSAAAMVLILGGTMYYLAGSDAIQTGILFLVTGLAGFFVLRFNPTDNNRVAVFKDGWNDILASSDHVKHSLVAFVRGEWIGVGIGHGTSKLTTLPFPHTDSVFAVIGEETGVIGAAFVVILFAIIFWRGLVIANNAPDGLGSLLAAGLTLWITLEAFMNMASLLGLMPFAGNTLPFFSIGGSNLVSTMAALGIVLNISRLSERNQVEESRRNFGAIVDLRRWNRWRRISRPRRTRSARRRSR
ncbi:MAG: cell division protein FtsW [Anaerolineales bacterium]|nr:cell division protein FtsW [Chloroflexota bacterium]MBL6980562.1 cell division protein FtsW [Anaerolineales bacterium]